MDFLLSFFFNSNTSDPAVADDDKHPTAGFPTTSDDQYFLPWKWHWRESDGAGWFEIGDQTLKLDAEEAALGKLTFRVWNRDADTTEMRYAEVRIKVLDASDTAQPINNVFSAYKYEVADGTEPVPKLVPFVDGDKGKPILLMDVPGGDQGNADNGDQRMGMWDVIELYFNDDPANYNVKLTLIVKFGAPGHTQHKIFFLDPEMDQGFTLFVL